MSSDHDELQVIHNEAARRFEVRVGDALALLDYRRRPDRIWYIHTEVPSELEGRGIAGRLARAALDYARESGLTVVPICPFVAGYLRKHPEYQDLVDPLRQDQRPGGAPLLGL